MPLKQSFSADCFRRGGEPLADLFAAAKAIGYDATELAFPDAPGGATLEEFSDAARSAGLSVACFAGHRSLESGLNDPVEHDRIEGEIIASVDRAARLGIGGIIVFAGNRRDGLTDEEGMIHTANGLRRVIPHAEERGVNLLLEILNSRVDHPGSMADSTAWAIGVCDRVPSPRMRILFDAYHAAAMGEDAIESARAAGERIGHVHTAGHPGRHELVPGDLDHRALARELDRLAYAGYVGHELMPRGDRRDALASSFAIYDLTDGR